MTEPYDSNDEPTQRLTPLDERAAIVASSSLGNQSSERLSVSGIASWIFILIVTFVIVALTAAQQYVESQDTAAEATATDLMPINLQGKMLVGQRNLPLAGASIKTEVPEELNAGTYEQHLGYVVLVNELEGAEAGLAALDRLDVLVGEHDFEPSQDQQGLRDAVGRIIKACHFDDWDDSVLSPDQTDQLTSRLGWLGTLATVPAAAKLESKRADVIQEAVSSTIYVTLAAMAGLFAMLVGFVLLVLFCIFVAQGKINGKFDNRSGTHNIYVETFALWMLVFWGLQFTLPFTGLKTDGLELPISLGLMFGSLIVLAWPVYRGLSFGQVCDDIGLRLRSPMRDFFAAPAGYLATMPVVLMAVIVVAILMTIAATLSFDGQSPEFSSGSGMGSHPIQEYVAEGGVQTYLLILLTACVAAPIVEEIMFRGVFYRHLRDWTQGWRRFASVAFSALLNGFIFAAIHPQGIIAIPLLGTLAVAFSIMREWRDSLYPSMIMHAINNGLVTCLMFVIL